jgi:hypothetical protein
MRKVALQGTGFVEVELKDHVGCGLLAIVGAENSRFKLVDVCNEKLGEMMRNTTYQDFWDSIFNQIR